MFGKNKKVDDHDEEDDNNLNHDEEEDDYDDGEDEDFVPPKKAKKEKKIKLPKKTKGKPFEEDEEDLESSSEEDDDDEDLDSGKKSPVGKIIAVVAVAGLLGGGGFFAFNHFMGGEDANTQALETQFTSRTSQRDFTEHPENSASHINLVEFGDVRTITPLLNNTLFMQGFHANFTGDTVMTVVMSHETAQQLNLVGQPSVDLGRLLERASFGENITFNVGARNSDSAQLALAHTALAISQFTNNSQELQMILNQFDNHTTSGNWWSLDELQPGEVRIGLESHFRMLHEMNPQVFNGITVMYPSVGWNITFTQWVHPEGQAGWVQEDLFRHHGLHGSLDFDSPFLESTDQLHLVDTNIVPTLMTLIP